jgi:hypothetical protein
MWALPAKAPPALPLRSTQGQPETRPVYFFYNDLGPEQFNELLKRAKASNQSFD